MIKEADGIETETNGQRIGNPPIIDVFLRLDDARADWAELEQSAKISPYQTYRFLSAWSDAIGRHIGAQPLLVVLRDAGGRPLALLPLCVMRRAGLNVGEFLGGRECNFNLPLIAAGVERENLDWNGLLRESARGAPNAPDLFFLRNMPERFEEFANPLVTGAARQSPSNAYGAALPAHADELAARLSKDTRKKLRKKEARLAELGALSFEHCVTGQRAREIIDALLAQKAARFADMGLSGAIDAGTMRDLFVHLSGMDGDGALEMHALSVSGRILATYAGVVRAGRFSALMNSYESEEMIARSSPGDLLLHSLMRNLVSRGFTHFDLGAGEARYKNAVCDETIELRDAIVPASARGALVSPIVRAFLIAKHEIKRNQRLSSAYFRARRLIAGLR
jgi:CelD/BcsL family acetyltransferase involved in cellulose biosynthesis